MRILRSLLSFLVLGTIFGVVGFFITREVLFWVGTNSVRGSLLEIQRAQSRGNYYTQCLQKSGDSVFQDPSVTLQLRFLNDTDYVLEAICNGSRYDSLVISRKSLPFGMTKLPGTAGIVWGEALSTITITIFDEPFDSFEKATGMSLSFLRKQTTIGVEGFAIIYPEQSEYQGFSPVSSCEGYGYQCCHVDREIGVGEQIIGLDECEKTCFSACTSRPVLLAFTTNPFFTNQVTREIEIANGDSITFAYVGEVQGSEWVQGLLDFGDGQQTSVMGSRGEAHHKYSCPGGGCTYKANLTLLDQWGSESSATGLSTITVVVK